MLSIISPNPPLMTLESLGPARARASSRSSPSLSSTGSPSVLAWAVSRQQESSHCSLIAGWEGCRDNTRERMWEVAYNGDLRDQFNLIDTRKNGQ